MRSRTRRMAAWSLVGGVGLSMGLTEPALAHGIGGRSDLPLELSYFLVGGGIAVVASFIAVAVLWPEPRLQGSLAVTPTRRQPPRWSRRLLQGLGLVVLAIVVISGLFGRDNGARSIVPVLIWVVTWLVVPFVSAVVGNVWADLNPWRTLASTFGFDRDEAPELLDRVGVYPAAIAFAAFTWLELVYPDSGSPRALAIAAVAYSFYALGMASWAGTKTGLQIGDLFTVYARVLSAISPFGRDTQGRLVWRGWFRSLPALPAWKGLTAFVVLMIGTVTYDGLSGTPWWNDRLTDLGLDRASTLVATAGFIATSLVIGAAYWAASWLAGRVASSERPAVDIMSTFAHTLVPIALAYAVAHYFTLVVFEGQLLWIQASDPMGLGWDLFGTAGWRPVNWLSTTAVWYIQVIAIVGGHIAGVVLAHDRALSEFGGRNAVRSQYAMLVLMVLLTGLGLAILAAG